MAEKLTNVLISACGTSLWTNDADPDVRTLLGKHSNFQESEIPNDGREAINQWLETRAAKLCGASDKEAARLSAEINGLLGWYAAANRSLDSQDIHYLVASDTYLGKRAAAEVANWLEAKTGRSPELLSATGLNTAELMNFRSALSDLVKELYCRGLSDWRSNGQHVAFNLTGGFKSVNGFMQTLGMLFADECFYLFEGSSQVMRVPRLPLKLDAVAEFRDNLRAVRRMTGGCAVPSKECGSLSSFLLFEVCGECLLSEWGAALWAAERKAIYGNELMEPLSEKLSFSENFRRQAGKKEGCLKDARYMIGLNECLDALGAHLDAGKMGGKFAASHKFKELKGRPKGSKITHEFYIWAGKGSRGYGYFVEKTSFVVDKIGKHL